MPSWLLEESQVLSEYVDARTQEGFSVSVISEADYAHDLAEPVERPADAVQIRHVVRLGISRLADHAQGPFQTFTAVGI